RVRGRRGLLHVRAAARPLAPAGHRLAPALLSRAPVRPSHSLDWKGQLPPGGPLVDCDRGHPLDPPVTAQVGCDQPTREAGPSRERHSSKPRGDEQAAGIADGKTAVITGQRTNVNTGTPTLPSPAGGGGKCGEQSTQPDTRPVLRRVEAAGAS